MTNRKRLSKVIKRSITDDDLVIVDRGSAVAILNRLFFLEVISKDDRTIIYDGVKKLIDEHNERLKDFPNAEDKDFLRQKLYGKRTYNSILNMLFDIKNGVYDGSYCPRRKTFYSLLAAAFPKYEPIASMQRLWSCGIEVQKVNPTLRTDLLYSGKWLDGGQILSIVSSLHRSIRSLLVTNPIVLLYLEDFIRNNAPKLERLWIELPNIEGNTLFEIMCEERESDLFEQRKRYRLYQESVQNIIDEFGDEIDIRLTIIPEKIFRYSTSLVVANIDISSGDYGSCLSSITADALYGEECECQVKQRGDSYISRRVEIATS